MSISSENMNAELTADVNREASYMIHEEEIGR